MTAFSLSTASVTAGIDLKGKTLLFQRYATARKRWVQVKKVKLTTSVPGPAKPTVTRGRHVEPRRSAPRVECVWNRGWPSRSVTRDVG